MEASPAAGTPPAILLVDDNPGKRMTLRTMLDPLGHRVVEADSGRAALRAVLRETFALILMDVRMPTMDGYTTAKLIRRAPGLGAHSDHLRHRVRTRRAGDGHRLRERWRRLRVCSRAARCPQGEGVRLRRSLRRRATSEERTRVDHAPQRGPARQRNANADAILDNVSDAIIMVDERGRIVSANRAVTQIFGYARRGDDRRVVHP